MARKRGRTRTVYRTFRRGYRKRKGLLSGNIGNIVWGAGLGFVSNMIPNFVGGYTKPLVFGAGGYVFKKPVMLGIAGYELGKMFSGGTTASNENFWES